MEIGGLRVNRVFGFLFPAAARQLFELHGRARDWNLAAGFLGAEA